MPVRFRLSLYPEDAELQPHSKEIYQTQNKEERADSFLLIMMMMQKTYFAALAATDLTTLIVRPL